MRWLLLGCSIYMAAGCGPATPPHGASRAEGSRGGERVLTFSVMTAGHRAGQAELRIEPDGRRVGHLVYNDRGRGPDLRTELSLDAAGAPRRFRATGHDYLKAPVDERLDEADGQLSWQSTRERGQAPVGSGWYLALHDSVEGSAVLARALLRAENHRIELLPDGEAWIDDTVTREVEVEGVRRRLRGVAIAGLGFTPMAVWLDEDGELFGQVSRWFSMLRTGADAALPALLAHDQAWAAARAARLAKLAHHPPGGKLAIVHARLYDSERRIIVPDATVVVDGDRIAAVGGATTPVPPGARVIDAQGRTLLPGLWDMHAHLFDGDGLLHLASGVTSVRDVGNNMAELDARAARFEAGTELGPRVLRAGLIDGPGPSNAPTGVVAATAEEATAAVARFADAGYVQIKIYTSVSPQLVPIIVNAAHARGLRVSGHVPWGMYADQAVESGYDEIQHVNQLVRRLLLRPEDDPRKPLLFPVIAERAADLDLDGPEARRLFDLLAARRTVLDLTLAFFHGMFTTDPGELDPVLASYAERLPAQVARTGRAGGLRAVGGQRARFRSSFAALLRTVKVAWDRKIPLVAGTDSVAGLSLSHELELYVQAGIPPAEVLSIATLEAARVMGKDRELGSIAVGKRADLVLVDGDPTRDILTVRNTHVVVCRGLVYDPAALFAAAGMRVGR
jgi:cytosine/adenosine deaminase-related metal-dependent hydrolase